MLKNSQQVMEIKSVSRENLSKSRSLMLKKLKNIIMIKNYIRGKRLIIETSKIKSRWPLLVVWIYCPFKYARITHNIYLIFSFFIPSRHFINGYSSSMNIGGELFTSFSSILSSTILFASFSETFSLLTTLFSCTLSVVN